LAEIHRGRVAVSHPDKVVAYSGERLGQDHVRLENILSEIVAA
jgi:hypothetical protein